MPSTAKTATKHSATHGSILDRTMRCHMSTTVARCTMMTSAMYGMYECRPTSGVEAAEREDGHRRPVLVVRLEESLVSGSRREPTVRQDEPLVSAEPLMPVHVHEHERPRDRRQPTARAERSGARRHRVRRLRCVGGVVLEGLSDVHLLAQREHATSDCAHRHAERRTDQHVGRVVHLHVDTARRDESRPARSTPAPAVSRSAASPR